MTKIGLRLVCKALQCGQSRGAALPDMLNTCQARATRQWPCKTIHTTLPKISKGEEEPSGKVISTGLTWFRALYLQQGLGHLLVCNDCCQALLGHVHLHLVGAGKVLEEDLDDAAPQLLQIWAVPAHTGSYSEGMQAACVAANQKRLTGPRLWLMICSTNLGHCFSHCPIIACVGVQWTVAGLAAFGKGGT